MKRLMMIGVMIVLAWALAACGGDKGGDAGGQPAAQADSQQATQATGGDAPSDKTRLPDSDAGALSVPVQLALGSLALEDTESAIDATLAAKLLPLWQAYQSLSDSDATAEAELNAVLNQIQDTMTSEQIQTIQEMKLTDEDIDALFEELGIGLARGPGLGGGNGGSGGGAFRPPGGLPGGAPGGGPGGLSPEARETAIAERFGEGVDVEALFRERAAMNTLIRTLQVKTGELDASELNAGPGRFMEGVSQASGVPLETLEAGIADGETTLAAVILANDGDLEAAKQALREMFAGLPGSTNESIDQRVAGFLGQ
jgi:hypothetical protein